MEDVLTVPREAMATAKLGVVDLKDIKTPWYQRGPQPHWVRKLMESYEAGAGFPVLHINTRKDGSLHLMDGLQRKSALDSLKVASHPALIYKMSEDDELRTFLMLNNLKKVHADHIVKSWPGLSGEIIRTAMKPGGILSGRVASGNTNASTRASFSPSMVARSLMAAMTGFSRDARSIQDVMRDLDKRLAKQVARGKANTFLRILADSFAEGVRCYAAVACGMGAVFHELGCTPSNRVAKQDWKKHTAAIGHGRDFRSIGRYEKLLKGLW